MTPETFLLFLANATLSAFAFVFNLNIISSGLLKAFSLALMALGLAFSLSILIIEFIKYIL